MANPTDNNDAGDAGEGNGEGLPLNAGKPAVAAAPGKTIFVIIGVAVFVLIVVKELFFTSAPPPPPKATHTERVASAPSTQNIAISTVPTVPETPSPPPPPPPPPPVVNTLPPVLPQAPPIPQLRTQGPSDEELETRLHANSLIKNSAPSDGGAHENDRMATNDPNLSFAQSGYASHAAYTEAKKVGNLNVMIVQGKIVQAILETAINSDLPGSIRAIVSHDIYAEAGRQILVPKGSRLIGEYNAQIKRGQARVYIIWTRLVRPDGVDIAINSPGIDALGRAGMAGYTDNKYFEAYEAAFLTSLLDVGVAGVGQGLFGNQNQTTTTGSSGTTTSTSGSAGAAAVTQAVQGVGTVSQSIVGSTLNLAPTITIDQGTPVNVFVNRDLLFPAGVTGHSAFVE